MPGQSMAICATASTVRLRRRTTDADFAQAPGPFATSTAPEQVEATRQTQTMPRPSACAITGTVPHIRAQSYFRSHPSPSRIARLVHSLNKQVHRLYGGDPSVVNPTRLMRLPGTIAWPWKEGRVPEVTQFLIRENRNQAYPLSLLTTQLPEDDEAESSRIAPATAARWRTRRGLC